MKLIDRYLIQQVLPFSALVMLLLTCLSALFVFIDQQGDIGVGSYGMTEALLVTALSLPQQAFQLLPIAALIGALLGLGNLARGSELIVLRSAGVSVARIAGSAAGAGAIMLLIGGVVGEFFAPPLQAYSDQVKTFAKYSHVSFAGRSGLWVKDGSRVISIARQSTDSVFGGVYLYDLAEDADGHQHLVSVARAERAEFISGKSWLLKGYVDSVFGVDQLVNHRLATFALQTEINPEFLGVAVINSDALPVRGLLRYLSHLRANSLGTHTWEVALWTRIARSLSTVLMCMLAVPFVFGSLRSVGAGSRLVVGIIVGVIYFLVNRTLENSGEVYGFSPLVIAWGPVGLLALVTAVGIARVR